MPKTTGIHTIVINNDGIATIRRKTNYSGAVCARCWKTLKNYQQGQHRRKIYANKFRRDQN